VVFLDQGEDITGCERFHASSSERDKTRRRT